MSNMSKILTVVFLFLSASVFADSKVICATGDRNEDLDTAQVKINAQILAAGKLGYTEVSMPSLQFSVSRSPAICVTVSKK